MNILGVVQVDQLMLDRVRSQNKLTIQVLGQIQVWFRDKLVMERLVIGYLVAVVVSRYFELGSRVCVKFPPSGLGQTNSMW